MRTIKFFVMAVLAISLAACSGGGKLTPTSKKVNGPLGKFFEVVERNYKMNDNELSVEFKRIAEGGPTDASWSSEPTFTVELQDEDGNSIASEHTNVIFNKEQLESVFSLGVDETASITFKFDKDKAKKATKFKVSSKWGEEDDDNSESYVRESSDERTVDLRGKVDNFPVSMHLEIKGSQVSGTYFYLNNGKKKSSDLKLSGTNQNGEFDLNETTPSGTPSGHFVGTFSGGIFQGIFTTNQGKKMPFMLSEGDVDDFDLDVDSDYDYDESDSDTETSSSSSASEDWDELLALYEEYVDKYISYVKKAAKGDLTALAEYPSLMEKAQEFSDKFQRAQGDMSASQWARYNKISMKMMKAAQEMQQ
ncbi:MAG: hypothetical protein K6D37_07920 [Prevotella sp.]|nr:hypothetical protein [Prevotella sp.]